MIKLRFYAVLCDLYSHFCVIPENNLKKRRLRTPLNKVSIKQQKLRTQKYKQSARDMKVREYTYNFDLESKELIFDNFYIRNKNFEKF